MVMIRPAFNRKDVMSVQKAASPNRSFAAIRLPIVGYGLTAW